MNKKWVISNIVASSKASGGDDFIKIRHYSNEFKLLMLADGATGIGNGKQATEVLGEVFDEHLFSCKNFEEASVKINSILMEADKRIQARNVDGDTTAILLSIDKDRYAISSVGDSEAWMITDNGVKCLTYSQNKKPRIGSGAKINPVNYGEIIGPIILFSDGLRYALPEFADWLKHKNSPEKWANLLLDDALNKWDKQLPDDLSIITAVYK